MTHRPRKRFGQNFLHDKSILDRIVAAAGLSAGDRVLEIGPGAAALTERLLDAGASVIAVEIDRDLGAGLQTKSSDRLDVRVADIMKTDWADLLGEPPYKLVANLPYNISSQVLFRVLDHRMRFSRLVLMFQKEVGERLMAGPGSRDYGILSVLMQTWFAISRVVNVPPRAFRPPPRVESVVLLMEPLAHPRTRVSDEALYRRLVKGAFAQRRKTLRNSLVGSGMSPEAVDRALADAGIDPGRRGETLEIEEFGQLTRCLVNP